MEKQLKKYYLDAVTYELSKMHTWNLPTNITYNSVLYLDLISTVSKCTVSYLADKLKVAKSAITVKVKELEAQGLVEKVQSKEDKRVFFISLTPAMVNEYKNWDKQLMRSINSTKEKFDENKIKSFCEVLEYFNECYNKDEE